MSTTPKAISRAAVAASGGLSQLVRLPGLDLASSLLASTASGWRGSMVRVAQAEAVEGILLYEFEGCPFCRVVRAALTELDLDADIRPCPAGGRVYRPEAIKRGGRAQFPLLILDGVAIYESAEIIAALYARYGQGHKPPGRIAHRLALAGSQLATFSRGFGGLRARPAKQPREPLLLYSFEASPYSRLVRERLCELEIPYRLKSFGKARATDIGPPSVRTRFFPDAPVASRNRQELLAKTGRTQVPYLEDPNTGAAMFESKVICNYLETVYAA
ncbi:glutathione S-transferase N-terminal domain-containing protein [Algiphilus aromaticivorans]|uniref:glutathione S-transferase N-terminal domain-containing protein n=1 Tax=Algiphilus aromaticivorans TaxID=382454 RepID=UPI0018DB5B11|nr:glutathione S-transferase N-terminal domain-containing protein [Algiphilus aromaticivorans]